MIPLLLGFLPILAAGQTLINFSALPACANSCTPFKEAESGCVPPRALQATVATYFSCFCQSALLQTFKAAPSAICTDVCSVADLTTMGQWYNAYCAGPVPEPDIVTVTVSQPGATPGGGNNAQTSTSVSGPGSTGGSSRASVDHPRRSWMSEHYGWVIFLVILVSFMAGGYIFGVWFRRRLVRKRDAQLGTVTSANQSTVFPSPPVPPPQNVGGNVPTRSEMAAVGTAASRHSIISRGRSNTASSYASPIVWGPHQHQAHTNGYEYPTPSSTPINSPPVPQPVYGPRFSRERLSGIHPPDRTIESSTTPSPVSPIFPTYDGYSQAATPRSSGHVRPMASKDTFEHAREVGFAQNEVPAEENGADRGIEPDSAAAEGRVQKRLSKKLSKPASKS